MQVFEFQCRLKFLKDVEAKNVATHTNYLLDSTFSNNEQYLNFHESRGYKFYVTDYPYPIEPDGIYKKGKDYTLRIRTVKPELLEFFVKNLYQHRSEELLCTGGEIKLISSKRMISKLYSVTPIIIKNDFGYWKPEMSLPEYEKRLVVNLIKKYQEFTGEKIEEEVHLYDSISFVNKIPVKVPYKNIHLLGDKIDLEIANNEIAQKLAYFALGVGIGENNSRSSGFVNCKCF